MISSADKAYLATLTEKCALGDEAAMEQYASFYCEEHPDLMNDSVIPLVVQYLERGAAGGSQRASLNLGALYCDGQFVTQDSEKAIALLESARAGSDARLSAIAAARLGDCYCAMADADYEKAFDYYLEGVLLCNHPVALYRLGDMYRAGRFVRKDPEKAYFIYEKAKTASQRFCNDSYAQILFRIAQAKLDGIGTERDPAGAVKYLEMAKRTPSQSSIPENVREAAEALLKRAKEG